METFSTLGDQLIKVEVNEVQSSAFQCIICLESFLTRTERNEHLERHFVHRKCSHCDKMVIAIGDLDFELHRPVHCRSINDACKGESAQCQKLSPALCIDRLSPQPAYDISDASIEYIEKEEEIKDEDIPVQKFCEIHVVSGYGSDAKEEEISPTRKSRRRRARINYDENDHVLDEIALVSTSTSLKKSVDVHIAKKSESRKESKTDAIKETKADDEIDSSVVELLDFEINDADVKEDDDEEEGDDAESIVFDMQFDELSCDDSEGEDLTFKKPKRTRGKIPKLKPKTIPCPDCKLMFRAERTLKSHRKRDHGFVQRNICTICGREFKDAGNLTQHMHTHGDSKRYICNFCGKGFHMPYNLKEHMHQHTGERPYKCSVCSKTFNRQTLRTAHMRVHTGEKPFKCKYENCDRAYAYSTDLKRHRRSVHGEIGKTFPCPLCGKVFHENKFLTKHLNVHQGKM